MLINPSIKEQFANIEVITPPTPPIKVVITSPIKVIHIFSSFLSRNDKEYQNNNQTQCPVMKINQNTPCMKCNTMNSRTYDMHNLIFKKKFSHSM
jgi:hypothetical protein